MHIKCNYKWETDYCYLACELLEFISQVPSPYDQIFIINTANDMTSKILYQRKSAIEKVSIILVVSVDPYSSK